MKRIISLVCLSTTVCFAGQSPKLAFKSLGGEDTGVPIREAKFQAKIEKHTFSLEPDYEWKTETVCLTSGTFVVFKGPVEGDQSDNRASCDAVLDGKPVKVVIPGGLGIGKADFASRETEIKGLFTGLYVKYADGTENSSLDAMQFSITRDVGTFSMTALVSPMTWQQSWSDQPSLTEYFTAEIDVEDRK
jgi:hypothetical protein